jgi:ATP diphosphatase
MHPASSPGNPLLESNKVPHPQSPDHHIEIKRLMDIMARLRDPVAGCPWDLAQTFESIAPYTIEEAYEVTDAIARRDFVALPDELGDLLFQVVYHARLAEEAGVFDFADVVRAISDKMVRRHPHVFGDATVEEADFWEAGKARERGAAGVLAGVPGNLPALTRAEKLSKRAARVGFDWPDIETVLAKLDEEVLELRAELAGADADRLEDELGDMLFVLANLARKLKLDPEACLARANAKFAARFNAVERLLAREGVAPAEASLARMEAAWQAVKKADLF